MIDFSLQKQLLAPAWSIVTALQPKCKCLHDSFSLSIISSSSLCQYPPPPQSQDLRWRVRKVTTNSNWVLDFTPFGLFLRSCSTNMFIFTLFPLRSINMIKFSHFHANFSSTLPKWSPFQCQVYVKKNVIFTGSILLSFNYFSITLQSSL